MEIETMGQVLVPARIESLNDLLGVQNGTNAADQVRAIDVADAMVDTGAKLLGLPRRMIEALGLTRFDTRRARTTAGIVAFGIYGTVRLTVQGRACTVDVAELPDECPVLIGYVPLELLDFVVDPTNRRLVGNPQHGGEFMMDMF